MKELVADVGNSSRVFIDIPIGLLKGSGRRLCDEEARRKLRAPRASSVFPPPVRQALSATSYEEASHINRANSEKGLTRQTYAIMPKIKQVDKLLQEDEKAKRIVREVHPEICFWALAGGNAMKHRKKTSAGFRERLKLLKRFLPTARKDFEQVRVRFRSWDLADDDILDAMAAAIAADANRDALRTLPKCPPLDCCGLPMQMVYRQEAWPRKSCLPATAGLI